MQILKCTYHDAQTLSNLIAANLPAISGQARPKGAAAIRAHNSAENLQYFFQHIITGTHAEIYIISDHDQIIGWFKLSKNREYEDNWLLGEIEFNYILGKYRGYGYGRQTLQYIERRFISLKFDKLYTWILAENRSAQLFYERHGYHFDGRARKVLFNTTRTEKRFIKKITPTRIIRHIPLANGEIRIVDETPEQARLAASATPVATGISQIFRVSLNDLAATLTPVEWAWKA